MFITMKCCDQSAGQRLLFSCVLVAWCELPCQCYAGKPNVLSESAWADDADAMALLQVSARVHPSSTLLNLAGRDQKECLNFLHIPKNAGTSIEDKSLEEKRIQFGKNDKSLNCSGGFWDVGGSLNCNFTDGNGRDAHCPYWHVPPAMDSDLALSYSKCDTFCVVRHPVTKLVSELLYEGVPCDDHLIDVAVRGQLSSVLEADPYDQGCHWVPQTAYVYGHGGRVSQDRPFCKWVLKFESLADQFDTLMQVYGIQMQLKDHSNEGKPCTANLSKETQALIEDYYAVDFETLGYERMNSSEYPW